MATDNPYQAHYSNRDHDIWEEGRIAGKADEAESVKELVEAARIVLEDYAETPNHVTSLAAGALKRAYAKAT